MKFFPSAHANGPQWVENATQVALQLRAQIQMQPGFVPGLGLLYISQALLPQVPSILALVQQALPEVPAWCGAAGGGVLGGDVSYGSTAAIGGFLLQAEAEDFYVFSGLSPLSRMPTGMQPELALVHADPQVPELEALLAEVASHTRSGQVLGGLAMVQLACVSLASGSATPTGVLQGGLSGVALRAGPWLHTKVVEASRPMGEVWRVTHAQGNVVLELHGRPALAVVLQALGLPAGLHPLACTAVLHDTWVGLSTEADSAPQWSQLVGLDVVPQGLVMTADVVQGPLFLRVHQKDMRLAHNETRRACAEIMDELTHSLATPPADAEGEAGPRAVAGVLLVRHGTAAALDAPAHASLDAQLELIRQAFGPVPLLGWDTQQTITAHGLAPAGAHMLVFTQPLEWPRR